MPVQYSSSIYCLSNPLLPAMPLCAYAKYFTHFILHTMYFLKFLFLSPVLTVKQYQYFNFLNISFRFRIKIVMSCTPVDWHSIYMHSDYVGSYFIVQFTPMVLHLSKRYKIGMHALISVDYETKGLIGCVACVVANTM